MTLPKNYNFEIPKILRRIKAQNPKKVALQFPDGLLKFAPTIAEILPCKTIILSDVVYGACCVDDKTAFELGCDLLIHFGHSCLIPVKIMKIPVLYVFVDIFFDIQHCVSLLKGLPGNVAVMGTIQYNWVIKEIKKQHNVFIPQIKPLSAGEVLGCTAPLINGNNKDNDNRTIYNYKSKIVNDKEVDQKNSIGNISIDKKKPEIKNEIAENKKLKENEKTIDTVFFIADGRFHLEALMLRNPDLKFYRYCPFNKKLFKEYYEIEKMIAERRESILKYKKSKNIGLIRSRLQENTKIIANIKEYMKDKNVYLIYVDEITEAVHEFDFIEAFVQVACPRLSIDWGSSFRKPLLNSAEVVTGEYKMNFYSQEEKGIYKH
ncbi:2-(3-amino-3-carboxypropyl)histidine synthase subunit 1 [Dictyocoela muelleri]|nr:2-(3-amino-3-carboxypropyl)histidine synthase subunit 1 [Dictyocoela muelleri]